MNGEENHESGPVLVRSVSPSDDWIRLMCDLPSNKRLNSKDLQSYNRGCDHLLNRPFCTIENQLSIRGELSDKSQDT